MLRFYIFILLLIFIGVFLLKKNKYSREIYFYLTFFVFFFVSAFRSMWVGTDTPSYYLLYGRINAFYSVESIQGHMESGFMYFCKLLSFISEEPQFLLIVTSFIMLFFVFRFIHKYSNLFLLSVLIYVCDTFLFNLTGMRQSLAMVLVVYSFDYILKKNFYYYCLIILLATMFHKSALLFLPVYFLFNIEINLKKIIYIISFSAIAANFFQYTQKIIFFLFPSYIGYTDSVWFGEAKLATILKLIMNFIVFITSYYFYSKQKIFLSKKQIQFYNILLWLSLIGSCISMLSIKATLFSREILYFTFFNIVLLPNSIHSFRKKKVMIFVSVSTIMFFILYAGICLYYRPTWFGVIPYTFCWEI